jgi:hypothetical protein
MSFYPIVSAYEDHFSFVYDRRKADSNRILH